MKPPPTSSSAREKGKEEKYPAVPAGSWETITHVPPPEWTPIYTQSWMRPENPFFAAFGIGWVGNRLHPSTIAGLIKIAELMGFKEGYTVEKLKLAGPEELHRIVEMLLKSGKAEKYLRRITQSYRNNNSEEEDSSDIQHTSLTEWMTKGDFHE